MHSNALLPLKKNNTVNTSTLIYRHFNCGSLYHSQCALHYRHTGAEIKSTADQHSSQEIVPGTSLRGSYIFFKSVICNGNNVKMVKQLCRHFLHWLLGQFHRNEDYQCYHIIRPGKSNRELHKYFPREFNRTAVTGS